MKKEHRTLGLAFLLLLFWATFPVVSFQKPPDGAEDYEAWLTLRLGAVKAGYLHEQTRGWLEKGRATISSSSEMKMVLNRLGKKIEMAATVTSEESEPGELLSVTADMLNSQQVTRVKAAIEPGVIHLTSSAGGREFSRSLAYSGKMLGPEGIRRLTFESLKKKGDSVEYQTFSSELSAILKATRTLLGTESAGNAESTATPGSLRVLEEFEGVPIKRTLWLDEDGRLVRSSESNPFGELVLTRSSRDEALLAALGAELPAEQYENTIVRSNVRLPQARLLEALTIRIIQKRPELGFPSFQGPGQKILEKTENSVTLRIEKPVSDEGETELSPAERREYLGANVYLDSSDDLIKETAHEIIGPEASDLKKAILLRNWVTENTIFDAGIVFAPSSEVIRNRRGTCVSFATLLTSLARAAGIPARYLMGYVYADGMWGGHAWAELFIDGRWTPFDSAMPGPDVADAARFAYVSSSLHSGPAECVLGGQQLFGNIEVEILDYTLGGRKMAAPTSLYRIEGNEYHNLGLKLRVRTPAGFVFGDTDKTWPHNILVSMSKGSEKLAICQHPLYPSRSLSAQLEEILKTAAGGGKAVPFAHLGRQGLRRDGPGTSAAVIVNGVDLWELRAEGESAGRLLDEVLSGFKMDAPPEPPDSGA